MIDAMSRRRALIPITPPPLSPVFEHGCRPVSKLGDMPPLFEVEGTPCAVSPSFLGVEIKICATRYQILKVKFTKFDFGPPGGAYRSPQDQ